MKKLLVVVAVLVLLLAGAVMWARVALGGDAVRVTLAAQVGKAIGQPVTIGRIGATVFPRVTISLGDVRIGEPARVQLADLRVGTDLKALLSRRIEHATLQLDGARIDLPLPPFKMSGSSDTPASTSAPVQLVSVDEIVLHDVQISSGGQVLRGDVELVPAGNGVTIRKVALTAGGATVTATGAMTDLAAPAGEIDVKAGALDVDQLMAFATAFGGGAGSSPVPTGTATPPSAATASPSKADLKLSLDAERATLGGLTLQKLSGRARVTGESVTLDPVGFEVFGGRYDGSLVLKPEGSGVRFKVGAKLTGVDVAAAARFAGSPDTITGHLNGRLDCEGRATNASTAMRTARGTAKVEIANGVIRNLGLVQTIVLVTSGRPGSSAALTGAGKSKDEPFTRLGATLRIADGAMTTDDLRLESRDVLLDGAGGVQMAASTVNLKGRVQLSDALSQQAGRDLVKYTGDQGRVTLPATVSGPLAEPKVTIDVGDMAKRAITNAAAAEVQKRIKNDDMKKVLGGLFKR